MPKPDRPTISVSGVRPTLVDLVSSAYSEPAGGGPVLVLVGGSWLVDDAGGTADGFAVTGGGSFFVDDAVGSGLTLVNVGGSWFVETT